MRSRLYSALILAMLVVIPTWGQAMITSNVISRTFFIQCGGSMGTAFTIDHASKQYLVTARHVVEGITSGEELKIFHEKQWKAFPIRVVGLGSGEIDIAVLASLDKLSPAFSLPLATGDKGPAYGQQMSFLGFPFGWEGGGEHINDGFPIAFVKTATLSAIISEGVTKIYLDAHINKGFSGGPLVCIPHKDSEKEFHIFGIISGYYHPPPLAPELQPHWEPLVNRSGEPITDSLGNPRGYVKENSGIGLAIHISHAVELIEANPIGSPLPAEDTEGGI